jgi:vacuolar-type H+-ATPase subunit H
VPELRDFLSRFRPAGAPGAARAAVPADQHRRREDELEPVLRLLDGLDAECAQLVAAAQSDAAQIIAAARADAADVAADAARRAAEIRREASSAVLAAARAQAAELTAGGAQRAAQARALGRQRIPGLARQAVALVRNLDVVRQPPDGRPPHPGGPS